jgi:hypothetical protein
MLSRKDLHIQANIWMLGATKNIPNEYNHTLFFMDITGLRYWYTYREDTRHPDFHELIILVPSLWISLISDTVILTGKISGIQIFI